MIRGKVQLWVAYVSKNFDDVKMPRDEMWVSYEFHALRNLKICREYNLVFDISLEISEFVNKHKF